jgi:hypothetical protein
MFRTIPQFYFLCALLLMLLLSSLAVPPPCFAQTKKASVKLAKSKPAAASADRRDREIAARFAPIFRQALGERRRSDLITNFDFDGDWRGDNNWSRAEDEKFRLKAFVYYAVSETPTHYYIHYAVFHPQDYKGGGTRGAVLSEAIREGVRLGGKYDPTGLSQDAVLAHENDMEGCLVVVVKSGDDSARATVAFVETLAHDRFLKYVTERNARAGFKTARMDGQRAILYVEPKGHGISAYDDGDELKSSRGGALEYRFEGRADDAEGRSSGAVGYELLPIFNTLWPRARKSPNATFGAKHDYGSVSVSVAGKSGKAVSRRVKLGELGAAFAGGVGARNAARPPWGWFDRDEREQPLGAWFFDPASVIKRHFNLGNDFSNAYLHAPFLGVRR